VFTVLPVHHISSLYDTTDTVGAERATLGAIHGGVRARAVRSGGCLRAVTRTVGAPARFRVQGEGFGVYG
jgi:hypothetical protein